MIQEKFLLDANSFITPYKNYYPFDFAPGFWKQLKPILIGDSIFILDVVKDELAKGKDDLTDWISSIENLKIVSRKDLDIMSKYSAVLNFLQESPLYNDKALRTWSNVNVSDPWLIATASARGFTLVTLEESAGKIPLANPSSKPKIPDIAQEFGVKCVNMFYLIRKMNIRWN